MTVYGLSNCDTTKAAIKWLKERQVSFAFNDFKINGAGEAQIQGWLTKLTSEKLLNKKSTTWRALSTGEQAKASTVDGLAGLLSQHNNLVKRPLVQWSNGELTTGFDKDVFTSMLADETGHAA